MTSLSAYGALLGATLASFSDESLASSLFCDDTLSEESESLSGDTSCEESTDVNGCMPSLLSADAAAAATGFVASAAAVAEVGGLLLEDGNDIDVSREATTPSPQEVTALTDDTGVLLGHTAVTDSSAPTIIFNFSPSNTPIRNTHPAYWLTLSSNQ